MSSSLISSPFPEKEEQKDSVEETRKFKKSRARARKAQVAVGIGWQGLLKLPGLCGGYHPLPDPLQGCVHGNLVEEKQN